MTRSVPLVLLILASAFLLTTCAAQQPMAPPGPCLPDSNNRAPIVCIDDSSLSSLHPDREPVHIYKGARAHFWTASRSGSLSIISSTLPADAIDCIPGQGHCIVDIRSDGSGTHKYWAVVTKDNQIGTTPDPTIVIDTN